MSKGRNRYYPLKCSNCGHTTFIAEYGVQTYFNTKKLRISCEDCGTPFKTMPLAEEMIDGHKVLCNKKDQCLLTI